MRFLIVIIIGFIAHGASASYSNIPDMYRMVAEINRVPPKLFYAMILRESRSSIPHSRGKKILPWPWTINHKGKAHYFSTRQQAYEYARWLIERGDKRFDVGLGQINWRWHEKSFLGIWEAFDPYTNLNVAARYLRKQYEKPVCNSWVLAVGCYHRPGQSIQDKEIANNYARKVIRIWKKI